MVFICISFLVNNWHAIFAIIVRKLPKYFTFFLGVRFSPVCRTKWYHPHSKEFAQIIIPDTFPRPIIWWWLFWYPGRRAVLVKVRTAVLKQLTAEVTETLQSLLCSSLFSVLCASSSTGKPQGRSIILGHLADFSPFPPLQCWKD